MPQSRLSLNDWMERLVDSKGQHLVFNHKNVIRDTLALLDDDRVPCPGCYQLKGEERWYKTLGGINRHIATDHCDYIAPNPVARIVSEHMRQTGSCSADARRWLCLLVGNPEIKQPLDWMSGQVHIRSWRLYLLYAVYYFMFTERLPVSWVPDKIFNENGQNRYLWAYDAWPRRCHRLIAEWAHSFFPAHWLDRQLQVVLYRNGRITRDQMTRKAKLESRGVKQRKKAGYSTTRAPLAKEEQNKDLEDLPDDTADDTTDEDENGSEEEESRSDKGGAEANGENGNPADKLEIGPNDDSAFTLGTNELLAETMARNYRQITRDINGAADMFSDTIDAIEYAESLIRRDRKIINNARKGL